MLLTNRNEMKSIIKGGIETMIYDEYVNGGNEVTTDTVDHLRISKKYEREYYRILNQMIENQYPIEITKDVFVREKIEKITLEPKIEVTKGVIGQMRSKGNIINFF